MKSVCLLIALLFTANAFAARQKFTCTETTKNKEKYEIQVAFDPTVVLAENWSKTKTEILGYDLGKDDVAGNGVKSGTSTARAILTIPKGIADAGDYKFAGYYNVNTLEKAGGGYSSEFDNKAYRSIHGYDKTHAMDMMFYYPDTAVGAEAKDIPALVTYQPSTLDQGYYNVHFTCVSEVK